MSQPPTNLYSRYRPELQSVRGIAALCVALHHALMSVQLPESTHAAIDAVFNAHAAVVVFFVLSGYVLGQSLNRVRLGREAISHFYTRRVFRIYPALWTALGLALIGVLAGRTAGDLALSGWYGELADSFYSTPTAIAAISSLVPISTQYNPPSWSIFVELVGSLALPIMILIMRRDPAHRWTVPLVLAAVSLSGYWFASLQLLFGYPVFFALGALLALDNPLSRVRPGMLIAVAIGALLALLLVRPLANAIIEGRFVPITYRYTDPLLALAEGVAAALLLGALVARPRNRWLEQQPLIWLGDISYSLYLLHFPLLFLAFECVGPAIGLSGVSGALVAGALAILAAVLLAALTYRFVELPAIREGKRVADKALSANRPAQRRPAI